MKKNGKTILVLLLLALLLFAERRPAATPSTESFVNAKSGTGGTAATESVTPTVKPLPGIETPDPDAYRVRNWENDMRMPSPEQIDGVRRIARSPYIAIYPRFPNVSSAIEYSVDLHADHQPNGTYLCPMNWWMDVSPLQSRYASVYNDFTGTPGGYCGFQTYEDGTRVFIMTVWSTFCEDYAGNVTVFTPEVIYPQGAGKANIGNTEGSFTQCIYPFDWHAGKDYRFLLQQSRSETTGNVVLSLSICDLQKSEWRLMASFDIGVPGVYMSSMGGFLENFVTAYAGEVRSMQLSHLRARSADTLQWVSADSTRFLLNGSISDLGYAGSAAFGTEGDAIWAITSGVSGLCLTPSDAVDYPLTRPALGDPY